MRRQAYRLVFCLGFLLFAATGCYDQFELKDRWLVVGVALDPAPEGLRVTLQIPIERSLGVAGGPGGAADAPRAVVLASTGSDLESALAEIRRAHSRVLRLNQVRMFAFGATLARRGLRQYVDELVRDPEVWPEAWAVVVDGDASDLLRAEPPSDEVPLAYTWKLLDNRRRLGELPDSTVARFYVDVRTQGIDPVVPVLRIQDGYPVVSGIGLFRGDRLVGTLDPAAGARLLLLMGTRRGGTLTVPCPEGSAGTVTLRIWKSRSTVSVSRGADDAVGAAIHVSMDTTLASETCAPRPWHDQTLEAFVQTQVQREARQVLELVRRTHAVDPLGVGAWVRGHWPEVFARAPWPEQFRSLPVDLRVSVTIRHRGMFLDESSEPPIPRPPVALRRALPRVLPGACGRGRSPIRSSCS